MECTLCEGAYEFNSGIVGKDYGDTGLMLVLHKSDSRAITGYFDALMNTNTGKTIEKILSLSDLTFDDIVLTNFYKCLLPDDDKLTGKLASKYYENCREIMDNQIAEMNPKKMVLFGSAVYNHFFDDVDKSFSEVVGRVVNGKVVDGKNYSSFISYHPSGLRLRPKKENVKITNSLVDYIRR